MAAKRTAAIRKDLERRGEIISPLDLLIAGMVMSSGLMLVTHNTVKFSRMPNLPLEEWL